ncbi:hypothetical protein TTHERM_001126364 (macronuclear) [Tetrahymena thermophila SB210]|uniref:Uncharacterized protein n=1 Tax=Tetrahymena thermophila (strain SB210) TaxID=312017 RepID=W7XF92_TETTS|nr:hypothetical protein TTHERM_001126364 [Tetrahymena thermophila SB210]EWS71439.1 hypothetical protein TTHERM_001126364 [Tetrahymena thermophila SB210]|eukprot:XP_012656025.1 hypothetical protein TTHERM_001126364 [Tetrahymena thermophila SB210]
MIILRHRMDIYFKFFKIQKDNQRIAIQAYQNIQYHQTRVAISIISTEAERIVEFATAYQAKGRQVFLMQVKQELTCYVLQGPQQSDIHPLKESGTIDQSFI